MKKTVMLVIMSLMIVSCSKESKIWDEDFMIKPLKIDNKAIVENARSVEKSHALGRNFSSCEAIETFGFGSKDEILQNLNHIKENGNEYFVAPENDTVYLGSITKKDKKLPFWFIQIENENQPIWVLRICDPKHE